jgi:hypothetical protein
MRKQQAPQGICEGRNQYHCQNVENRHCRRKPNVEFLCYEWRKAVVRSAIDERQPSTNCCRWRARVTAAKIAGENAALTEGGMKPN